MDVDSLFNLLAIVCFLAAAIVAFIHKSWTAGLFCLGFAFLVLAGGELLTT